MTIQDMHRPQMPAYLGRSFAVLDRTTKTLLKLEPLLHQPQKARPVKQAWPAAG